MTNSYLDNAELSIVENTETGLFHGAVYCKHQTPSGSDCWALVAIEIARLHAEQCRLLDQIVTSAIKAGQEAVRELIPLLRLLPSRFHRSELRVWLAQIDKHG